MALPGGPNEVYLAVKRRVQIEERLEAPESRHVRLLLLAQLLPPRGLDLRLLQKSGSGACQKRAWILYLGRPKAHLMNDGWEVRA